MSSHMSVATVIEKNKIASSTAFIVAMDVEVIDQVTNTSVETLRFCRNSENVTYGGNVYTASSFDINIEHASGEMSAITLTAVDYSSALQGRMQAYGGGIGFNVTVMILNMDALSEPCELKEFYKVIGASAANYVVTFNLGNRNPLTIRFPRRIQMRDRCAWKYKGTECGYAGVIATCDLSLNGPNGCSIHGRSEHFGGFPGINPGNFKRG